MYGTNPDSDQTRRVAAFCCGIGLLQLDRTGMLNSRLAPMGQANEHDSSNSALTPEGQAAVQDETEEDKTVPVAKATDEAGTTDGAGAADAAGPAVVETDGKADSETVLVAARKDKWTPACTSGNYVEFHDENVLRGIRGAIGQQDDLEGQKDIIARSTRSVINRVYTAMRCLRININPDPGLLVRRGTVEGDEISAASLLLAVPILEEACRSWFATHARLAALANKRSSLPLEIVRSLVEDPGVWFGDKKGGVHARESTLVKVFIGVGGQLACVLDVVRFRMLDIGNQAVQLEKERYELYQKLKYIKDLIERDVAKNKNDELSKFFEDLDDLDQLHLANAADEEEDDLEELSPAEEARQRAQLFGRADAVDHDDADEAADMFNSNDGGAGDDAIDGGIGRDDTEELDPDGENDEALLANLGYCGPQEPRGE
eukprot:124571-Prymnesium_polylepis.1